MKKGKRPDEKKNIRREGKEKKKKIGSTRNKRRVKKKNPIIDYLALTRFGQDTTLNTVRSAWLHVSLPNRDSLP